MDTNPLAVAPELVVKDAEEAFKAGLQIVAKLTEGDVFVCRSPGSGIPGETIPHVRVAEFGGPHPAGLSGTHMHFLRPATSSQVNWYLNYQDVIAFGTLFLNGVLDPVRIISLAGPSVRQPATDSHATGRLH